LNFFSVESNNVLGKPCRSRYLKRDLQTHRWVKDIYVENPAMHSCNFFKTNFIGCNAQDKCRQTGNCRKGKDCSRRCRSKSTPLKRRFLLQCHRVSLPSRTLDPSENDMQRGKSVYAGLLSDYSLLTPSVPSNASDCPWRNLGI